MIKFATALALTLIKTEAAQLTKFRAVTIGPTTDPATVEYASTFGAWQTGNCGPHY